MARRRPREACGVLLGRALGPLHRVLGALELPNGAPDPRRGFRIPARELARAVAFARRRGQEVVGLWHSHPEGPPWPSRADAGGPPGWSLLLGSPIGGAFELRSFRVLAGERTVAETRVSRNGAGTGLSGAGGPAGFKCPPPHADGGGDMSSPR